MMGVDRPDAVEVGEPLRALLLVSLVENLHWVELGIGETTHEVWMRAMRPGFGQAFMNNETRL